MKMDPKTRLDDDKRQVHPIIHKILVYDVDITKRFVSFMLNFVPIRSIKTHCKMMEYSCHGIVWLAGWLGFCWFLDNKKMYQMQINMFVGLILDIILVAVIKAATRRRRPTVHDDLFTIGPDKFSFPSGHASRAFYILMFFTAVDPVSYFFWPPLIAWASTVALSRLLLYRHHILDVLAGIVLGILEAFLISILWIGPENSNWIMAWISDDKLPGGEQQDDVF